MNTSGMGYKILDGRYALLECLAVSGLGEVYRGRDLELTQTNGAYSLVLIHLLPVGVMGQSDLENLQALRQTIHSLRQEWVLPMIAQGNTGERVYFVLGYPSSRGVHSLVSLSGNRSPSQQQIDRQLAPLVRQGLLRKKIDSALILSLPNRSLCLLGTALLPSVQALNSPRTSITIHTHQHRTQIAAFSFGIMTIALSTFAVEYISHLGEVNVSATVTTAPVVATAEPKEPGTPVIPLPTPHTPDIKLAMADTQLTPNNRLATIVSESFIDDVQFSVTAITQTEPINVTVVTSPILPTKPEAKKDQPVLNNKISYPDKSALIGAGKSTVAPLEIANRKPKELEKTQEKPPKNQPEKITAAEPLKPISVAMPKKPEPEPKEPVEAIEPIGTITETVFYTASAEAVEIPPPAPSPPPKQIANKPAAAAKPPPTIHAAPLDVDSLVGHANLALDSSNFSQRTGVLFYAREIRKQAHLHPQVERLGRAVVLHYHEKARALLQEHEQTKASGILNSSKALIQEFNLKNLNPAQQLLEQKIY